MAQEKWKLSSLTIDGTQIPYSDVSPNPGINTLLEGSGGTLYNEIAALMEQKPTIDVQTLAIKTVLDIIGMGGYCISSTIVLHYTKQACLGIASGSVHKTVTINDALIVPVSISASQGSAASLSFRIYPVYDGSNAPFVFAGSAAAPTVHRLTEHWHLGPLKVGSTLYETESFNIDFGITVNNDGSTGIPYTDFAGVVSQHVSAGINSTDAETIFTESGSIGTKKTNNILFLRKGDDSIGRVANATAQHIKFTFADSFIKPEEMSGGAKQYSNFGLMLDAVYDGTNAVIAYDAASAIS